MKQKQPVQVLRSKRPGTSALICMRCLVCLLHVLSLDGVR